MSDTVSLACNRLQTEEGFRGFPYQDQLGNVTVGYGFCLKAGLSKGAAAALLNAQVAEIIDALSAAPWYATADPVRQSVFVDVAFNVGLHGLYGFAEMLNAAANKDWQVAAAQLLDSDAARLNRARYANLAAILASGADPPLIEP